MKIVHISAISITTNAGGMNVVIPQLIELQSINNVNDDISLLLVSPKSDLPPMYHFPIYFLSEVNINDIIEKTDLFIFHSVYNLQYISLYLKLKKSHKPYIIVTHGALTSMTFKRHALKKSLYKKLFLDSFVKNSLAISYLSEDERQCSVYQQHKYIVVPNVLPKLDYKCRLHPTPGPLKLVFMSKIDYYTKGLDVFFSALKLIEDELVSSDVTFHFYGYGNSKFIDINNIDKKEKDILRLYKDINSLKFSDKMKFWGPVFGEKKFEIMHDTDIMLLPSRSEGMPLSVIEFLSVGTPCFITKNTNMGNPILAHGAGWVAEFTPKSLADTLLKAISSYKQNSEKYRMAARKCYEDLVSINIGEYSVSKYKSLMK